MRKNPKKKILVTGSSGFIGSNILRNLENFEIISDYKFKDGKKTRINLKVRDDVLNIPSSDLVIHAGGLGPKYDSVEIVKYFDNNVVGTINVLEYCIKNKVKSLIYLSSYVYGNSKKIPINENQPINPHTPYNETKYLGERLCKEYSEIFGLNVIVLRIFNVFGKSQKTGFLIPNLLNSIKTEKKIIIKNKKSKRDFLYIDDLVNLLKTLLKYNFRFEVFNVGSGSSYSFEEIVKKIQKISNKKLNISYIENNKDSLIIDDARADISKIKSKINWIPKITLEQGLKLMLDNK